MKKMALLAVAIAMAGCGGSSDSEPKEMTLTLDASTLKVAGNAVAETKVTIPFRLSQIPEQALYVFYSVDSPAFTDDVVTEQTSEQEGYMEVTLQPGYAIGDGETEHNLELWLCHDASCEEPVAGAPRTAKIVYDIDLNESVTVADPSPGITYSAALDAIVDDNLLTKALTITGASADKLHIERGLDGDLANQVSLRQIEDSQFELDVDLKLPRLVGQGSHSRTMQVNLCYDVACDYHIEGSPLEIPVAYNVAAATKVPASAMSVGERKTFSNIGEAEYIPSIDALVMMPRLVYEQGDSSQYGSPSKIEIYFLETGLTQEISFESEANPPHFTSLAADQLAKQGRFAVNAEEEYFVFDYNIATKQFELTTRIEKNKSGFHALEVRRDDLYTLFPNLLDSSFKKYDINTGIYTPLNLARSISSEYLSLSHDGDRLYFSAGEHLASNSSEGQGPLQTPIYYGSDDVAYDSDVWFGRFEDVIISRDRNVYDVSQFDQVGSTPLVRLPNSENRYTDDTPIATVYDAKDSYIVGYDYPAATVRELDKQTNQIINHYDANEVAYPNAHELEVPVYVFKSDAGHIYALKHVEYDKWDSDASSILQRLN